MSDLSSLIAAQQRAATTAGARGEKPHLLLDADQNIGNQLPIKTPPVTSPPMTVPTQNPDRLLNLNAASKSGQMITVFLGAEALPNISFGLPPSPFLTGIIEFGNGSRFSSFEMDIPLGPTQYSSPSNKTPVAPQNGGILVSVPAGTLRVYARSDASLITPDIFGQLPPDNLGNNPPDRLSPPIGTTFTAPASNVLVTAFAGYFTRTALHSPTKTLWLGTVTALGGVGFLGHSYAIPAFARTISILRDPLTVAISFILQDTVGNKLDTITIPAGTRSDTYKIPGNASRFLFFTGTTNPVPNNATIQAIFELEI